MKSKSTLFQPKTFDLKNIIFLEIEQLVLKFKKLNLMFATDVLTVLISGWNFDKCVPQLGKLQIS